MASRFQEMVFRDSLKVFSNTSEFAAFHWINGVQYPCQIDSGIEDAAAGSHVDRDLRAVQRIIRIRADLLPVVPVEAERMRVDGGIFEVVEVRTHMGMLDIYIERAMQ